MPEIRKILFDDVPHSLSAQRVGTDKRVMVIWPAPVDADACFADAGFTEFYDSDEIWDRQWRRIVDLMIGYLHSFGVPSIRNHGDVIEGWTGRPLDLSYTDRIVLSSHDDQFDEAFVDFGGPPPLATLSTCAGHPLLWIAVNQRASIFVQSLAEAVAEGRPIHRRRLPWQRLLGKSH